MSKAIHKSRFTIFDAFNALLMAVVVATMLYPFIQIISASVSDPLLVMQNKVNLLPKKLTLVNYRHVFSNNNVMLAYWNTIRYTVVGTIINIIFTFSMAYPLSRKRFMGRRFFMKFVTFTMLFSGGLIPTYLVVRQLKLINTIWAVVLIGAVSTWNLIISRTFFETIPDSLEESAIIDGANDMQVYIRIFLPLSGPIIATMVLFYAVGHWNNFFTPLIYLNDKNKYPLQIFLRNVLLQMNMTQYSSQQGVTTDEIVVAQSIKYTIIVVTTLPIIFIYPFLQKYFVKGVMIGAIKG